MLNNKTLKLIGFTIIINFLVSCTSNENPTTVNSGSAKYFGYAFKKNGSPAIDARIAIIHENYVPENGTAKSTSGNLELVTDAHGYFSTNEISSGTYNIFAISDGEASFTPSVKINSFDSGVCIIRTSLQVTGSIKGRVQFPMQTDNRGVLVLLLGSEIAGWPYDSLGNITLKNMAPGDYKIRILPLDPQYTIIDTTLSVQSGMVTDFGTIVLSLVDTSTIIVQDKYISGVWGPDKTYKIVNTVAIPKGERLEIKEGTRIVFMGKFDFGTDGNCFAKGTVEKPVIFTYRNKNSTEGWGWFGIFMENDYTKILNSDSLMFNNCIFEYCIEPYFELQTPLSKLSFEMKNCIFRHMIHGLRVQLLGSDQSMVNSGKRVIVKNCVFHDIKEIDTTYDSSAYQISDIPPAWAHRMIDPPVYVHDYGFPWPCNAPSVEITNNIFFKEEWGGTIHCYYSHNCYTSMFLGQPQDSTNVFGDPLFLDIQNGDYHLTPNSPCIGSGVGGVDMGINFH